MKSLSLYLLTAFVLAGSISAQSQPSSSQSKADEAVVREWLAHAQPNAPIAQDGRIVFSIDDRDNYCAFMRTYRVKREELGSDVTRPAGYTTCVPTSRFAMKSSAQPKVEAPAEPRR